MKECSKCFVDRPITEFYKDKYKLDGYRPDCKSCVLSKNTDYRKKNKLKVLLQNIKYRCNNKCIKDYGGRGIKCLITEDELKELWFRDNACDMNKPSIDRINNDGDYIFENCRFIELGDNVAERNKRVLNYKKILQYDLGGNFIREWDSLTNASKNLKISISSISFVLNKHPHRKTAGGFKWRIKNA